MDMADHRQIIRQLGGIRGLARRLGHRNHTTVQGWWERGAIPTGRLNEVLAVAAASPALCTVCDHRLDDVAIRACSLRDCPNAQRDAA